MDGAHTLLIFPLLLFFIPGVAWGVYFLIKAKPRRVSGIILLAVSLLIGSLIATILSTAPAFDFVDRCRPAGTGVCTREHPDFDEVRRKIRRDYWLALFRYVGVPSIIGVSAILGFLIVQDRVHRSIDAETAADPDATVDRS